MSFFERSGPTGAAVARASESLWLALGCLSGCLLMSCGSPLVGAECKPERALCDGTCVNLNNDFRNCGQCGNDCGPFVCSGGMCRDVVRPEEIMDAMVMLPDGNVVPVDDGGNVIEPDAGEDAEVPSDDAGGLDADTGLGGCGVGRSECSGRCVYLGSDLDHCGGCDNACQSGQVCSLGLCATDCGEGLIRCGATCFDRMRDPRNCGGCGNVCASGICRDGECSDAVPGQLVVVGHDYVGSNRFQDTLLGNALFLADGAPVQTLVFAGSARGRSIEGVERAIDHVATSIGRQWEQIDGLEPLITYQLASADAFLIHAQEGSSDSVLTKQGELWGMAMAEFLLQGGVVVVIDGGRGNNDGAVSLLEPAQLFGAQRRTRVVGEDLEIMNPGIGIAIRVGGQYRGATNTVRFEGVSTPGTPVTSDSDGFPVIFQRIIRQ